MTIGASTSNLYPMNTEDALNVLLKAGFKTIEIFINTVSETTAKFARQLRRSADEYGACIKSLHSYNSISDAYILFSDYARRLQDGMEHLERVFESANIMGASFVVIHGDRPGGPLSNKESILRYEKLFDLGQKSGITLLQENVVNYRSADLSYLRDMRNILGEKAQFVFDIKQSRRCGLSAFEVISAMAGGIRHVHISDSNKSSDCIVPGRGELDYKLIFNKLMETGFDGDVIIELYRNNYNDISDLVKGCIFLQNLDYKKFNKKT